MPIIDDEKLSRDSSATQHSNNQDRTPDDVGDSLASGEKRTVYIQVNSSRSETPESNGEPKSEHIIVPGLPFQEVVEENYRPKSAKFWLIIVSTFIATFLVALDRTILTTAIPQITNDFDSLGDIGWYGSAYMLTTAAFQLLFGRMYRFYDLRPVFLLCIVVFEIGSAICGSAPNSVVFIVGRSIAGMASAGIMTGSMLVIIPMVPLRKRPMFQSMFGLIFGLSSAVGPLIGGAFTETATWRWCFYMNLPIGGVAFACLFCFLPSPKKPEQQISLKEQIMRLDPLGTLFFVPSMVCLVLALQWGGSTYEWKSWRIIILWVVFGLTAIVFGIIQVKMPKTASLPVKVITQRTMLAGAGYMVLFAGAMFLCIYYLPLWFQSTHGVDPVDSGIYTLPLVLSLPVAALLSGAFTQRIGYYMPSMILCPCLMAIGEGLLTTVKPTTGSPHWIAYQFLVGFGLGSGMQTVGLAVQTTLPLEEIPTGMAITLWAQQLGGAIFVSVGQTILSSVLVERLGDIPGVDARTIVDTGVTDLHRLVPAGEMDRVVDAFNLACTKIFLVAAMLSAVQVLCACCVEVKSIKKGGPGPAPPGNHLGK